jgi:hypothetical protein
VKEYHENGDLVKVMNTPGSLWEWGIVVSSKEVFRDTNQRDYEILFVKDGRKELVYGPDILTAEGEVIVYRKRNEQT